MRGGSRRGGRVLVADPVDLKVAFRKQLLLVLLDLFDGLLVKTLFFQPLLRLLLLLFLLLLSLLSCEFDLFRIASVAVFVACAVVGLI